MKFEPISDRICYVELKDKWFSTIIINCYAPTNEKNKNIKNVFYEELERICIALLTGNPKIILSDLNAKIGKEAEYKPTIRKNSLHIVIKDNGNKLITFATVRNMRKNSTMFPHKKIHILTRISLCGEVWNQINHVMVDYRIRLNMKYIRSIRGSSAFCDDFLVKTNVKIRI